MALIILGIGPLYLVGFLSLLGAMRQRRNLRREIYQYANLRRVAQGRPYRG